MPRERPWARAGSADSGAGTGCSYPDAAGGHADASARGRAKRAGESWVESFGWVESPAASGALGSWRYNAVLRALFGLGELNGTVPARRLTRLLPRLVPGIPGS